MKNEDFNYEQLLMYILHSKGAQLTGYTLIFILKALITLRGILFAEHESSIKIFSN